MDDLVHYKNRRYYAQNREDLIIRAFFPDLKNGFYIDIGAYDPDFESVTKYFYDSGWSGVNVEPQPENFKRFLAKRKRDINVNAGISNSPGKLMLRSYKNGGLSTFSTDIKQQYEKDPSSVTAEFTDIEVPVLTLNELYKQHSLPIVNFMKVDVEGLEYAVLEGNDWKANRPQLLCIESNHMSKDWSKILLDNNYAEIFFDGLNKYYADKHVESLRAFDYVKFVILERGGGLRIEDYNVMIKLKDETDKLRPYSYHLAAEVEKRDQTIAQLASNIEMNRRKMDSIRQVVGHLFSLIKRRISGHAREAKQ